MIAPVQSRLTVPRRRAIFAAMLHLSAPASFYWSDAI